MGMSSQELYFNKLKPCIHFLMDTILYEEICSTDEEDFMDTQIDLLEVYTTLEVLCCMGEEEAYELFLSHKQVDQVMVSIFKQIRLHAQHLPAI